MGLPRLANEMESKLLEAKMQPYIVGDSIDDRLHYPCHEICRTRTLKVYVPAENIQVEFNYPHIDAENPLQVCQALVDKRPKEDISDPELSRIIDDIGKTIISAFVEYMKDKNDYQRLLEVAKWERMSKEMLDALNRLR